jgi:ribosome-binding factor A
MPREYKRSQRVGDLVQQIVGELLIRGALKDPRLDMVTITGVKLSDDLRHATVYFAAHGSDERQAEARQGFESAAGFIRSHLRRETDLRFIPELRFQYDKSMEEGAKIDRLLREVRESERD